MVLFLQKNQEMRSPSEEIAISIRTAIRSDQQMCPLKKRRADRNQLYLHREIGKLRREGILLAEKNRFTLLERE